MAGSISVSKSPFPPPAKLTKLHEKVTLTKVVNDKGLDEYKISCVGYTTCVFTLKIKMIFKVKYVG